MSSEPVFLTVIVYSAGLSESASCANVFDERVTLASAETTGESETKSSKTTENTTSLLLLPIPVRERPTDK